MAANVVSSKAGTVSGTDPSFTVSQNVKPIDGNVVYVKYTAGSAAYLKLTIGVVNTSIHATDVYLHSSLNGEVLQVYTMYIYTAGNYRIPIPSIEGEVTLKVYAVFSGSGLDGTAVIDVAAG